MTDDRLPPHDIGAERSLLGSLCIADPAIVAEVRAIVRADQFFEASHQVMYGVLCRMFDQDVRVDAVTLRAELERRQLLDEIGGLAYLAQLLNSVPSAAHAVHYGRIVREQAARREIIATAEETIRAALAPGNSDDTVAIAQAAITRLTDVQQAATSGSIPSIGEVLRQVVHEMSSGGLPCVATGFRDLDSTLGGGIGLGEMMILCAYPSMGKSTLMKQIAVNAARAGHPAAIISLEEPGSKIGRNILAGESAVNNAKIRSGQVSMEEWREIEAAADRLAHLPLNIIDDTRHIDEIAAKAAVLKNRSGMKLLCIDYLQRIRGGRGKSAYEQVSDISGRVSDLVKNLGVAAIIISSLNRGGMNREDKRPAMNDLRESGQIEFDADVIVALHREDYYHLRDAQYRGTGEAELLILKNREGQRVQIDQSGRARPVVLKSNLALQRFENIDRDPFARAWEAAPAQSAEEAGF